MAKKARKKKDVERVKSDYFQSIQEAAKQKFGDKGGYNASLHRDGFVGVPLPALAMEYLLGMDSLVLGMVYGIAGPPQSFKSALALELAFRTIVMHDNGAFLVETEGRKISPAMIESLYGEFINHVHIFPEVSVEAAQDKLTWVIKEFREKKPENALLALILDSLSGVATEERRGKIMKEGHAQRDYSSEALYWTSWFKSVASELAGCPIALFFVNHEKQKVDGGNAHSKSRPGGIDQEFRSAAYISMQRAGENKGADVTVTALKLRTCKQSLGEYNRRINLPFVYKTAGQKMWFDWGHADADLLVAHKERVKDAAVVTASTASMTALTRTFSCKQLGVTRVSGADFGLALNDPTNAELVSNLRDLLGITKYERWDGLMPQHDSTELDAKNGALDLDQDPVDHDIDPT